MATCPEPAVPPADGPPPAFKVQVETLSCLREIQQLLRSWTVVLFSVFIAIVCLGCLAWIQLDRLYELRDQNAELILRDYLDHPEKSAAEKQRSVRQRLLNSPPRQGCFHLL